ncbi:OmpP1/FadL family transporter [Sulfuricaulis sp.]|jgi:long-chain fatty acid transport protein|uniref:OmpP1/FadL family transporter n=1 Tax=Sulfuricaulis sp. TaxID=2003553 RepID=UPI003559EBFA
MTRLLKRSLVLAVLSALPATALATNGMFMIGYSVKSVGMGGVAMAFPQDSMVSAVNPAGISEIGTRFDAEATLFLPSAQASLGGVNSKSRANEYLLPGLGLNMQLDNETSFNFSMVGAGGGGSHYKQNFYDISANPPNGTGNPHTGDLGVDLMVMQMNPTMSQKINDNNTLGATLVLSVARFKAFGLGNFTQFTSSQTDTSLTDRGPEYSRGMGMRFGWLGKLPNMGLTLGAAATSKIYMTKFQNYSELFAEQGDMDTPANLGAGFALKFTPKATIAMDVIRTYYSKVRSIANTGPNLPGDPNGLFPTSKAENGLGEDAGLGFGWHDQTVYKLGVNYVYNSKWTYRAGWNYGKSPINSSHDIAFNIVAPATTQHHATLGTTYKLDKQTEVNFAYMHAFPFEQSGPTYIGNSGTIKMSQDSFGIGVGFFF